MPYQAAVDCIPKLTLTPLLTKAGFVSLLAATGRSSELHDHRKGHLLVELEQGPPMRLFTC